VDRKMPRNWRVGIADPYASTKGLIRMSWDVKNTYNLSQLNLLNLSKMTVYQQRWKAKKVLRAYHFPLVLIRQFMERHFKTQLPTQKLSRENMEKVPPMQSLTFAEIERRLDTVVFRSHFAKSIFGARRAVVMGQVTVNGLPVRIYFNLSSVDILDGD
jgi:ribosomal protein S4